MTSSPLIADLPTPFLEVRVLDLAPPPGLVAVCAGYELGKWRSEALAKHMINWIPDFALRESERLSIGSGNAVEVLKAAANAVYTSHKYKQRGEAGELLLHIVLRQVFKTTPAVSKIFFKDSSNDTVKGFDAVHVVATDNALELWLGEAKFYDSIVAAVAAVAQDLQDHLRADYLRREFAAVTNKVDPQSEYADRLKQLLNPATSLDTVFDCVCVPVLLTYDSPLLATHTEVSDEFKKAFVEEVTEHRRAFVVKVMPKKFRIVLVLAPMNTKNEVAGHFDRLLKNLQSLS